MKLAFNTANLVARVSGYRFELANWGEQHRRTVAQTDDRAWEEICEAIAAQGFTAAEVWAAHLEGLDPAGVRRRLRALHANGLAPIGFAGALTPENAQLCVALGVAQLNGGFWHGATLEESTRLCEEYDLYLNFENHPEKSAAEILEKIGGGNARIGVCIDSGWLGTQGTDTVATLRALGPLVRHVHVKDIATVGKHDTCLLGTGVVGVAEMLTELKRQRYTGWLSWEDEPEDRNPFDSAAQNRHFIQHHWENA